MPYDFSGKTENNFSRKSKIMENSNDRWVPDNPPIQGTFREELFERLTLSPGGKPLGDRKGRPYSGITLS